MAFEWAHQETWDDGTRGNFDATSGTVHDFPHYKELARGGFAPWQGAHAIRLTLSGTDTGFITEDDGFDTTNGNSIHIWMPVLLGADLTLNDTDTVILFALRSGSADEAVMGVRRSGSDYQFFAGNTGATRTLTVQRSNSRWYELEASIAIGTSSDGTMDFFVDGGQIGAQIGSINHINTTHTRLGAVSGTAAGNLGTILIGGIIGDDARIYKRERFPNETMWVTRDMTAWVGPCTLDAASVSGTSTNAVMTILDTDIYTATGTSFSREPVVYVRNITANDQSPGFNTPVVFKKGAYVQLTGTNPQAWVSIKRPSDVVQSQARYISRGRGRKQYH